MEAKYKLRKLLKHLRSIRGRHTELVTVYVPSGYSINEIINQLKQEQGTADNIKSKQVRKNVTTALEKITRHLQLYKRTPENGLAIFCGNVSEKEGVPDIELKAIEPPEPIKVKLYWCDQIFRLEPLEELIKEKEVYGLICMDKSEADIAVLRGKKIQPVTHMESIVPGKTRAGGQCLLEDTLIQLSNGEIVEIKDVHNPMTVKSMGLDKFSLKDSPILNKWDVNKYSLYKITTKYPRIEICASKDHVFFVWGNKIIKKASEELSVNDYLLIPEKVDVSSETQYLNSIMYYNSYCISKQGAELIKKLRTEKKLLQRQLAKNIGVTQTAISTIELCKRNIKKTFLKKLCKALNIDLSLFITKYCKPCSKITLPSVLDENTAQILGYFAGDGSREKERISLYEKDKRTIIYYEKLIKKKFGANTNLRFRNKKNYYVLRIYGKAIVNLIKNEFPEIVNAANTEVPKKILKSKNSILASFLKGLFDADGYVSLYRGMGLGINNKKFANQIQLSLLRFGILSSLYEYDNRRNPYSKKHRFTISITEKTSLNLFSKLIGFNVPYKREKLEKLIKNKTGKSSTRQIVISGKNIRKIIEEYGLNTANFPKVTNFFRNQRMMSKHVFENSILKELKPYPELYNKLKSILSYNLIPVKINKIEKIRKSVNMTDISVKNQNFIANGLIVHNSSQRFSRVREGLKNDWFKQVGEIVNKTFGGGGKEVRGIILGGPGPIKEEFLKGDYIQTDIKKKIIGIVDTSYTGEFGLHETVERGKDMIKESEIIKEKKIVQDFLSELQKGGLVVYGMKETLRALRSGAVSTLLLSEDLEREEITYECACGEGRTTVKKGETITCKKCGQRVKVIDRKELIDVLEEECEKFGTKLELISDDTREGKQFKQLGGIGGMLRYLV